MTTRETSVADAAILAAQDWSANDGDGFDRGTITSGSSPTLSAALADADILAAQDWSGSGWDGLDRRGNWTRTDRTVGTTPVTTPETRVANAVNLYTSIDLDGSGSGSAVTPEHDRRGNLTKDPSARNIGDGGSPTGQKFEYDEENRLVTVKRASDNALLLTIAYDALGRRVESVDYVSAGDDCMASGDPPVTTRHVFDGLQTIEKYVKCAGESSWTRAREFIWGDRFPQPLALIDLTGAGDLAAGQAEILHHLHDVLGSVVALTNASGQVVERYTYDPYGQTLIERADPNNGNPTQRLTASRYGNAFAWAGQRYDAGIQLYHFLFRTYLPHLGRWGQRDPAGYVDGPSLLEYVSSRPTFGVDPDGRDWVRECVGGAWYVGPVRCYYIRYRYGSQALEATAGLSGDKQNAIRHCIWAALLYRNMPKSSAETALDLHEAADAGTCDSAADAWNNDVGKRIGLGTGDIVSQCYQHGTTSN